MVTTQEFQAFIKIGDTITVKKGWGYNTYDPMGFHRSDGTVVGVITARHKNPNTLYFKLENGQIASGAISGMDRV